MSAQQLRWTALRAWNLLLISFLALFFELALIRWIPTRLRLLAYFSNFILIAALLGMGLGMLIDTFVVRPLLLPTFIVLTRRTVSKAARFLHPPVE